MTVPQDLSYNYGFDYSSLFEAMGYPNTAGVGPVGRSKVPVNTVGRIEDLELGTLFELTNTSSFPGRRIRLLPQLYAKLIAKDFPRTSVGPQTYGELYAEASVEGDLNDLLGSLPLRVHYDRDVADSILEAVPEDGRSPWAHETSKDPELHQALLDLGFAIGYELTQACASLDDPDLWYPGVDDGIDPVSDAQAALVIWASQRELNRETRGRPAVDLTKLPFHVQRAFTERRRWHYQRYGIGRREWLENKWSFWKVDEDRDWRPPWLCE